MSDSTSSQSGSDSVFTGAAIAACGNIRVRLEETSTSIAAVKLPDGEFLRQHDFILLTPQFIYSNLEETKLHSVPLASWRPIFHENRKGEFEILVAVLGQPSAPEVDVGWVMLRPEQSK